MPQQRGYISPYCAVVWNSLATDLRVEFYHKLLLRLPNTVAYLSSVDSMRCNITHTYHMHPLLFCNCFEAKTVSSSVRPIPLLQTLQRCLCHVLNILTVLCEYSVRQIVTIAYHMHPLLCQATLKITKSMKTLLRKRFAIVCNCVLCVCFFKFNFTYRLLLALWLAMYSVNS